MAISLISVYQIMEACIALRGISRKKSENGLTRE